MAYRILGSNVAHAAAETASIPKYGVSDATGMPLVEDEYLGLRRDAMTQLQYRSMDEVIGDLRKLVGTADLLNGVVELSSQPRDVIQAASHGPVRSLNVSAGYLIDGRSARWVEWINLAWFVLSTLLPLTPASNTH